MKILIQVVALVAFFSIPAQAYDLSGVVLDSEGAPVADARVWANQHRDPRVTRSDADGAFVFENLLVGPVDVVAYKEGLALGGVRGQVIDDAHVTIVLTEPDTIRLRTISTQYEPIAGARLKRIEFTDVFRVEVEDLIPLGFPSMRSDEEGFLQIESVPQNTFVSVSVSHRDFADTTLPAIPAGMEIDMPMPPAMKVRGRVANEAGEGVERARVSIYRTINGLQHEFTEVLTDREGFYSANATPERYSVAVRQRDYATPPSQSFQLTRDGADAIVDFVLPAPHSIVGRTVDTEGQPVPLVKLSYSAGRAIYDEVVSDVNGNFRITVATGSGVLKITPPERIMTVNYPEIRFEVGTEELVTLDPIEFQALPNIHGRVTADASTRIDKVLISSLNLDPPLWTTTDADGAFVIELDRMHDETLRFRAEHALRFLRRDFQVDPVKLKPPTVRLRTFKPDLGKKETPSLNSLEHMLGKPAPEIQCDAWFNLEGDKTLLTLHELRGKVVVLTLWGGFDTRGRTRHRINELNALYDLFRDDDEVAIVAVHDASLEPADVAYYVREYEMEFPVGCDADPFLTFDLYNTNVIPQTILIDKQGNLLYFDVHNRLPELIKDLRRR